MYDTTRSHPFIYKAVVRQDCATTLNTSRCGCRRTIFVGPQKRRGNNFLCQTVRCQRENGKRNFLFYLSQWKRSKSGYCERELGQLAIRSTNGPSVKLCKVRLLRQQQDALPHTLFPTAM